MDDILEIIGDAAEPVADTLKEWGEDIVDQVKESAPHYLRFVGYALKGLRF